MKPIVLIANAAILTGLTFAISPHLEARPGIPLQPQTVDTGSGKILYAENCASCHGARLEGQKDWRKAGAEGVFPAPPHDETGHTWHHGDGLLFTYTKFGGKALFVARGLKDVKSGMPGFGQVLSDQEIWDILAFIKSTWSERIRELQAARTRAEQSTSP